MGPQHLISDLLVESRVDDREKIERLIPLVYEELRSVAHRQLLFERSNHTLGTTGLVHEAYLKLAEQTQVEWGDRAQFFAVAARIMRRILVDYARRHHAAKRFGLREAIPLDQVALALEERADMLIDLDDALTRLAEVDERQSRVVEYRFFGGLTEEETADILGITARTVRRDWTKARGWLYRELRDPGVASM